VVKYRARWVARSRLGVLVSELAFAVFLRPPSPKTFALGSSSRTLPVAYRVSRVTARPSPPGAEHLPWGFLPHRDTTSGVYLHGARLSPGAASWASQAHFVPSSTFLTSSTASSSADVAGLFHPAATSGLRSSGFFPRVKPYGLIARRCPLVVSACRLPPLFIAWAPASVIRLQGFAPHPNPLRTVVV
jgi:hypothetical protein